MTRQQAVQKKAWLGDLYIGEGHASMAGGSANLKHLAHLQWDDNTLSEMVVYVWRLNVWFDEKPT